MQPQLSILIDTSSDVILTLSWHAAAVQFVHECTMDTEHVAAANIPNYLQSFPLSGMLPKDYPTWSWAERERAFVKTHPESVTEELRQRAILLTEKLKTISYMMERINQYRNQVRSGLDFQELVYVSKEAQARRLKDSGFDPKLIIQSPYVVYYADELGISIERAVEEILLQAQLDHEFLAKNEKLRMKYFNKVKRAENERELEAIRIEFTRFL
ncbi:hypothetical protein EXS56_02140 [Candidatus Kaiserbacteria bacterium]|nr:hypothetical protein [Candidatus Kaiserbacteria bacterium]